MNITLSKDQQEAFDLIAEWLATGKKVVSSQKSSDLLTFAGYAGSGKTTVISIIAKSFETAIRFAFCALSGKASSVIRQKLSESGVSVDKHYCGTIHRLIYSPIENEDGEVIHWMKKDMLETDIIVIDEASMVSQDIFNDLASYGKPILAIGDHGQLPPIDGNFNLMGSPDIKLEKIHRQAESNPIINLSMRIRETGKIPNIESSKYVKILGRSECSNVLSRTFKKNIKPEDVLNNAVLCYTNSTRNRLNSVIRKMIFGHESKHPVTNDVVICLRNSSNRKTPIYNGYRGFLLESAMEVENHYYDFKVRFPFEDFETKSKRICKHQFGFPKTFKAFSELEPFGMYVMHWSEVGLLFDYGYALTVHKMQGSQADNVILYNEKPAPVNDDTYRRWLYTATTRSSEYLTILK